MSDQVNPPTTPIEPDPLLPGPTPAGDTSWAATVSAACGGGALLSSCVALIPIVGCFCCSVAPILSIAGVVFGVLGLKSQKAGLAKAGLGMSIAAILVLVADVLLSWLLGIGNILRK